MSAYEEKAAALAIANNVTKVHPVVLITPDTLERTVCYIKEPNYPTKIAVMDKAASVGPYRAADELREACLIKEASDAITYSESPESDRYKLGVTEYCLGIVSRLQNQFKKK
jgi:hypothetical protein